MRPAKADGGTNLHDALMEALRADATEGMLPMVLFLTDGLPTVGVTNEAQIREAAARSKAMEPRHSWPCQPLQVDGFIYRTEPRNIDGRDRACVVCEGVTVEISP